MTFPLKTKTIVYTIVALVIIATAIGLSFGFASNSTLVKTVVTENGAIRGQRETSLRKNMEFYAFRGIPYAKAPLGELRFKVLLKVFFLFCVEARRHFCDLFA